MARRRASVDIDSLDAHPNRLAILATLARLPQIADGDLPLLAEAWCNPPIVVEARERALDPDAPLVIEALAAFDIAQALFADDVHGATDGAGVDPAVATVALKAVRDAIAAAYARPILDATQHNALRAPWRAAYPHDVVGEPDLGARSTEVRALLDALSRLATRCHDSLAAADYAALLVTGASLNERVHTIAREEAWRAAEATARRRLWRSVRRAGADGLDRACPSCHARPSTDDGGLVTTLCLDAACGLLVADVLDDTLLDVLTLPVRHLVPVPRPAAEGPVT